MTVKTSLGTQTAHKPPAKLCCDEDRNVTDGKYRIVFCVITTIWLATCICTLYCSNHRKSSILNETIAKNDTKIITHHHAYIKHNTTTHSTFVWVRDMIFYYMSSDFDFDSYYQERESFFLWVNIVFYIAVLLFAMRIMHHWATLSPPALIVMSSVMITTSIIFHLIRYFFNGTDSLEPIYKKCLYWVGPEAVLLFLSILTFLNIMRYTGVSVMCEMLKEAFRYYVKCRYLLIIGFAISATIILLCIFTSKILTNIIINGFESYIIYAIIYGGSSFVIMTTYTFGRMVISATAASYYWNQNDKRSPFKSMCQKIDTIIKYQFGSVCYKATYTSLLLIALLVIFSYDFTILDTAAGYCVIFDVLQLVTFDYTVFLIGIYGISASEATNLFNCLFKKPSRFIAFTCQGLWSATFLILFPTNCIMLLLIWGINENDQMFSFVSSRSYIEILVVSLPITFVLGTIEDTRAICSMEQKAKEEELKDEESLEEPTQVKIMSDSNSDNKKNEEQ